MGSSSVAFGTSTLGGDFTGIALNQAEFWNAVRSGIAFGNAKRFCCQTLLLFFYLFVVLIHKKATNNFLPGSDSAGPPLLL